ncbi:MAG: D-alanyl-D-alanine carboxypeptidase family protein [Candidatus Dormibacteria bacterium]
MGVSFGLLGGISITRVMAGHGASTRVAAARVDAAPVHDRASTAPSSLSLAAPPFSWDYRSLREHPATGAPPNRSHAVLMADVTSGRVLYTRNPHQRMPPASTAKLMTAMIALDGNDPSTVVTVPAEATRVEPNVMGLTAGERLPVGELLTGLLLDSGNDAAETLARATSGSTEAFVAVMNRRAVELGLSDTHFVNPSGLDDPDQFSSAHDLAVMAAYLERYYPLLAQIVSSKEVSIRGTGDHKAFDPINLNKLLWTYRGAIGFKTGLTDSAGTCLVAGARRGDHTIVLVELNDPLIFTDATAMLDYGFRRAG